MIWKQIPGYEEHYSVSEFGDVRNDKRNKFLKTYISQYGYKRLMLSKNGITKHSMPHQIVAIAFIGNANGKEINPL